MAKNLKLAYTQKPESKENKRSGGLPGYARKELIAPNFEYAPVSVDTPHFVQLRVEAINRARTEPPVKLNWWEKLLNKVK